ncbi:MAG: hypothetical protein F9K40_17295 [Kofleriaceae bacterium]|nr:MAG: hypothetical protein F9K40_17295 [Kofleriaceae bacterium]MBZ0233320.1 hypothetical protein [Kofleriaceae bacterium]
MVIGKRAMLVTVVIAALGFGACVVKTTPAHHHRRPAAEKHKKHKPEKHKKHKKHDKHRHRH